MPTPTPAIAAASTANPAATPATAPTGTPTGTPTPAADAGIADYAGACKGVFSQAEGDALLGDVEGGLTWGGFAYALDGLVNAYERLSPPAELREYHDANLRAGKALLGYARSRPSDSSFTEEFQAAALDFLEAWGEIGADATKTDAEKARAIEETGQRLIIEFFGTVGVAASQALLNGRDALSDETLEILGDNCYPDLAVFVIAASFFTASDFTAWDELQETTGDYQGDDADSAAKLTVGKPLEGALGYDGDEDLFEFEVEGGRFYQIDVALGGLDDSWVDVWDSDWARLATNDDYGDSLASRVYWEAPSDGIYYVATGGYGAGSYTLTVSELVVAGERGNGLDSATALTVGERVASKIDYDGDVDVFFFQADAGQLYEIDVELISLQDSLVEIGDSDGEQLAENDNYGDSPASRIFWEAPADGGYYAATGGYGAGSYILTVSAINDDHGNGADSASPVAVGEAVEGAIGYDGDVDWFAFKAVAGQLYEIDVALGSLDDSLAELLDSDGGQLAENDDYWDSLGSRIVWEAPSAGRYYVVAGGYESGTGSYTLTVSTISDDYGDDADGALSVAVGEPLEGAIDYDGDRDFFSFEAEAGRLYQIDVVPSGLQGSWAELLDSDGRQLAHNDFYGDSLASRIVWEAPGAGRYYVVAGGYGAGAYALTVSLSDIDDAHGNRAESATALTVGEAVDGAIDYDGDRDWFAFEAVAGQSYEIDVALDSLPDSLVELLDSSGQQLAENDDYGDSLASRIVWEAQVGGRYYVVVSGYDSGVGSYTLTVSLSDTTDDHANSAGGATALAVGEPVDGALDYDGDTDWFAFDGEAGRLYEIGVVPGSLGESWVELRDFDGELLAGDDEYGDYMASRIVWKSLKSGSYYVVADGSGAGSYTLAVSLSDITDDHGDDVGDTTALTVGEPVEGELEYARDTDAFAFEAEEGRLYEIAVDLGSLRDSWVALGEPEWGTILANDYYSDSPASRIFWEAQRSGSYYVVAGGYGAGTYTLTVAVSDIADDRGNNVDSAAALTVGESVDGALEYDGDKDVFAFQAEAGQLYEIGVALGSLPNSYMQVWDSDGVSLVDNDDYGDSPASRIVWEAPSAGKYHVMATGYGTGSYTLTVAVSDIADDHANFARGATAAAMGESVEGAIDYVGDEDAFAFDAEARQLYEIEVALGSLPNSFVDMRDSTWGLLTGSMEPRFLWKAPGSGKYYVAMGSFGTGSYTLTVSLSNVADDHADNAGGATALTVGEPAEGALEYTGDRDAFVFLAESGQLYEISAALGSLSDSRVELRDSGGARLAYNDDYGGSRTARVFWAAPSAGRYYVIAYGYDTGSYTLTVAALDIADDYANYADGATALAVGEAVAGALEYEGDRDAFALQAEAGQLYEFRVEPGSLPRSRLWLLDSDGEEMAKTDEYSEFRAALIVWEAPGSGRYYVVAGGYGAGSYALTVSVQR